MSSSKLAGEDSLNHVSPEALSREFLNEDDFVKASRETIFGVVSELLDVIAKTSVDGSMQSTSLGCSSRHKVRQKPSNDVTNCDSKDLPVRRSSRIQSKAVKKEEGPKKKQKKPEDTKFIDVVSVDEDMETDKALFENAESKLVTPVATAKQSVKNETEKRQPQSKETTKPQKTQKRSNKKADKKEETEKPKTERKRNNSRKRKQDVVDSEEASEDTSEKNTKTPENIQFKTIIKESSGSTSNITRPPFVKSHDSSNIEAKVQEVANMILKSDEDKSNETSDPSESSSLKPVKVKSRWWRSSELEGVLKAESAQTSTDSTVIGQNDQIKPSFHTEPLDIKKENSDLPASNIKHAEFENATPKENSLVPLVEPQSERPNYEHIDDNIYKFERKKTKTKKQVRRMICDCTLSKEEIEYGVLGCKEECLNRLLMIECGYRCPIGETCSNKRFQKKEYAKAEIFKAEKKGWGLRALEAISAGDFLMEFVGEVLNHKEYRQRVKQYAKEKNVHSYFMALKTDEILDATVKGNYTRFINHSCDPNCETQKWTVNGELRVGVFAKRAISAGEEFTLDYQFQRYGREAQKCLCGSYNCTGYIGGNKQISIDAYSSTKVGTKTKKKGADEKKRDWEDMTLEEEIEKLYGLKGLRNREETLNFARLMVRADDNVTRHQLLDIIIKTEEQACLRLFLDYHGLPLLWSWMTDVVDLELKAKILQVLQLLPIPNKTMLLDSKVMSIVEKWVQECDIVQKDNVENKFSLSALSSEANTDFLPKKLKLGDLSDSETDSSGSQHADNKSSSEQSGSKVNFSTEMSSAGNDICKAELSPEDLSSSDAQSESKTNNSCSKTNITAEFSNTLRKDISSVGSELLCTWKNLKEVFRIPRLEQQKQRKEDEREADHTVLSRVQIEVKKPEIEFTGNQIQVLISGKTANSSKGFDYEAPDIGYKLDHRHRKIQPKAPCSNKPIRRASEEIQQSLQNLNEDSSMDSESSVGVATSPVPQHSTRPTLLPIPTFINPPSVNFPPPMLPDTAQPPPIKSSITVFPPQQMLFPQNPRVNFLSTSIPPPNIAHPPTNMPPPSTLLPKTTHPPPLLQQPPPSIPPPCQPVNPVLPPISTSYILPSNVPPTSVVPQPSQYMPNQTVPVTNYPPGPNPFGNQNQSFYFVQRPPPVSNAVAAAADINFPENIPIQSVSTIPVQCSTTPSVPPPNTLPTQVVNHLQMQATNPVPLPSTNILPMQSLNTMPLQSTLAASSVLPVQEMEPSPVIEEYKPAKLPKNWRSATDSEGNTYYYHSVTRETQWDPPTADQADEEEEEEESEEEEEDSASEESESSDTPTYDEPKVSIKSSKRKSKKKKTTKAAADTSVSFPVRPEIAKKIKELFRTKMSSFIVQCLNHYRKPDCKVGRITNNEDFKYLARKLTHYIMTKEIKQLKNVEDLDCNETVTHKAKDFIKKYMSKYGAKYNRKEKCSPT